MENNYEIIFKHKILDNVHGFIDYTDAEEKIIEMLLFKRMQSIKQLSIVNWIFPGSEHTRYVHSLGVMHVCDRIARQLNLTNYQRRIVRFAGLLHDIGHYPLSHVGEFPYKNNPENIDSHNFCQKFNENTKIRIDTFNIKFDIDFMTASNRGHHEYIGAEIIRNNAEIRNVIVEECGNDEAIDIICDMITGNAERTGTDPLLVQILHSELDADGIDYMLRDATFSGTSFGSFELDMLIKCMTVYEYNHQKLLCIEPRAIPAADQYLINKFFSYSQIVYNKHVSILEWMAERIVDWMQKNNTYFPEIDELMGWITDKKGNGYAEYLSFTDNYFWSSLQNIVDNPASKTFPSYIVKLCRFLLTHNELKYVDGSEFKIISSDPMLIKEKLQETDTYKHLMVNETQITLINTQRLSKHIPINLFKEKLIEKEKENPELREDEEDLKLHRLMDGICICDKERNDVHLLCDDERSLMQSLHSKALVVMRTYELN